MVTYVIEAADWSVKWDGKYITQCLPDMRARTSIVPWGVRNQIIHFGSINTFAHKSREQIRSLAETNALTVTWYHLNSDDPRIDFVSDAQTNIDYIHTSCSITEQQLIDIGIPESKIVRIPIGVDIQQFRPYNEDRKRALRRSFGIPEDAFVVGSFQKDGEGWGEGMEPKKIKGPDVLTDVLGQVSEQHDIHVFLTGPARGYVKRNLESRGVAYTHHVVDSYPEMADCYNILDAYLVASRAEGGPKAVVETMATRVPLVSTAVGMVPDIVDDGETGLVAPIDDAATLTRHLERLKREPALRESLSGAAYEKREQFDWRTISRRYADELFGPLRDLLSADRRDKGE
jgi:glycosyltransferase involved in cell wall biosynthesis